MIHKTRKFKKCSVPTQPFCTVHGVSASAPMRVCECVCLGVLMLEDHLVQAQLIASAWPASFVCALSRSHTHIHRAQLPLRVMLRNCPKTVQTTNDKHNKKKGSKLALRNRYRYFVSRLRFCRTFNFAQGGVKERERERRQDKADEGSERVQFAKGNIEVGPGNVIIVIGLNDHRCRCRCCCALLKSLDRQSSK